MSATVRISSSYNIEMAHCLPNHKGACRNIHGHSFKLIVTVIGKILRDEKREDNGMVMDYFQLNEIVKKNIVDEYDHYLVLKEKSFNGLADEFSKSGFNIRILPFDPTCENLVVHFAEKLSSELSPPTSLYSLRLYESPSTFSEWFAHENAHSEK